MPFSAGTLIHVVLLLALAIFLGSLLLIGAAIGRRLKRERDFKILDSLRQRSISILERLSAGALDYGTGLEQLRGMIKPGAQQAVEGILLEHAGQPRYIPMLGRLLEDLGMIESWQRGIGAAAETPGAGRNALSRQRGARFYHRARDAQNLGRLGHRQSWPLLVNALDDPHIDVREAAVRSLAAIGDPQSFPALAERLRVGLISPQPALSDRILRPALARFPPELANHLEPMMKDVNAQVRLAAAQVLRDMLGNYAVTHSEFMMVNLELSGMIVTRLSSDKDPDVRAAAADLMALMKDEASGGRLIRSADDEAWFVRLHAVRALGERRNLAFHAALGTHLTDPHWRVREAAARALAAAGSAGTGALLRVFAATEDVYAREQIAEALETSGLMAGLASRCTGEDALPEREVLLEIVKIGKTSSLESWLRRQLAPQRDAFLAMLLRDSNDPLVQKWADRMAE